MLGFHISLLIVMVMVLTTDADVRTKRSDDIPAFQEVVQRLSQQVSQLTSRLSLMENKLNTALRSVAFQARHTADPFSVASKGVIIYDTVSINTGNGYDRQTGFFTTPVAGMYVFFINCMAVDSTDQETYIQVDGTTVAACYSYSPHRQPYEQGATMATVHLRSGQKVWVRINGKAEYVRGFYWNTFAGFLVHDDV